MGPLDTAFSFEPCRQSLRGPKELRSLRRKSSVGTKRNSLDCKPNGFLGGGAIATFFGKEGGKALQFPMGPFDASRMQGAHFTHTPFDILILGDQHFISAPSLSCNGHYATANKTVYAGFFALCMRVVGIRAL
ncbi:MAG: hypothetical protein AABX01_07450 [Candidatus Micrarchaeota archaeon]